MTYTLSYPRLVSILLLATYILIVLGASTRVFDAGMSCPDWPHCYGSYIPFPESSISGGYIVEGRHYVWWQVALEWSHRALASLIGLGIVALAILSYKRPKQERTPLIAAVLLIITQIALGGFTIFQANSPASVAAHLGTAMLFFGSLVWLRRVINLPAKLPKIAKTPRPFAILLGVFALTIWLTMIIGAIVSSSGSGGVCGGLFSCVGQWMPADLGQHLHMQHRFMALTVFALSIVLMILAKRTAPHFRHAALMAHLMVLGQVGWGIATLYSFAYYPTFYYPLSVIHLAWGTLVWMVAIGLILKLHYGDTGRFHG